jgi:hypothetical protein
MDEQSAREVVLVRAIESSDAEGVLFTADDRRHASRAAAEMARWHATQQGIAATDDLFLAKRAGLALDALGPRAPVARTLRSARWRSWIGIVLPLIALALGALTERIADRQHVNVLAFPLLALIAWNLGVYALLLLRLLFRRTPGPWRRWLAGISRPATSGNAVVAAATSRFVSDWTELSRRLLDARAGRVLHLAAALFAVGALAGLYLRALAFEYRTGWESTFLDASTVHAILSTLLGPAARLLGSPFPSVEAIEAMRISAGRGGTDAGPWIHLYAVTVGLLVIVPRLALSAWSAWRERRLETDIPLDLGTPYFRRLLATFTTHSARVRVLPYSYTLDEAAVAGLNAVARHLFGDATQLALRPSIALGAEDTAARDLPRQEVDVPLMLAVFNAATTPEQENHGRFLDALRRASDTPLAVLVDLEPYRRRLGMMGGAAERLQERCRAWQAFAADRGLSAVCIDLSAPELGRIEAELQPALAGSS